MLDSQYGEQTRPTVWQVSFWPTVRWSADGTEGEIRRKMIERGLVEVNCNTRNLFYLQIYPLRFGLSMRIRKVVLIIVTEKTYIIDREKEILFIDMRQMGEPF